MLCHNKKSQLIGVSMLPGLTDSSSTLLSHLVSTKSSSPLSPKAPHSVLIIMYFWKENKSYAVVVYFDQPLGAAHSKCLSKSTFLRNLQHFDVKMIPKLCENKHLFNLIFNNDLCPIGSQSCIHRSCNSTFLSFSFSLLFA